MPVTPSEERNWNTDEAALYLGCTPGTLRVWVSKRVVPYTKVRRLLRFRKRDLDGWLDSNAVEPK